jgi:prophage antirepressor-like protein
VGHRKKKFKKLWYEKVTFSPKGKFQLLFFSKKEPDKHFRKWVKTSSLTGRGRIIIIVFLC